jgi:hypothetical protein
MSTYKITDLEHQKKKKNLMDEWYPSLIVMSKRALQTILLMLVLASAGVGAGQRRGR